MAATVPPALSGENRQGCQDFTKGHFMRRMLGILAALVTFGLAATGGAEAQAIPSGSYLQTCRNVEVRVGFPSRLVADCQKASGAYTKARMNLPCNGTITNENGDLQCNRPRDQDQGRRGQNLPPGSYQASCNDLSMSGPVLSGQCRDTRGGRRETSINTNDCRNRDISVDARGALTCDQGGRDGDRGDRGDRDANPDGVTLFSRTNFQGQSRALTDNVPNLREIGFNDAVRSIQVGRNAGRWQVCTDSRYRGRCQFLDGSARDTDDFGLRDRISSVRRAR